MCVLWNWRQLKRNNYNHSGDWKRALPTHRCMVWTYLLWVSLQTAAFLRLKRRVLGAPQVSRGSTHHGEWTLITQVLQARCGLHVYTHTLLSHATAQKEPKVQRGKTALPRSQSLWFAQLGFEPEVHSAKICWSVTVVEDTEYLARSRIGAPQPSDAGKKPPPLGQWEGLVALVLWTYRHQLFSEMKSLGLRKPGTKIGALGEDRQGKRGDSSCAFIFPTDPRAGMGTVPVCGIGTKAQRDSIPFHSWVECLHLEPKI